LSFSLRELAEYWERDESDLKELVTTGKLRAHLLLLNAIEGESARGRVQLPAGHYRLHKESAHTLFTGRWVRQLRELSGTPEDGWPELAPVCVRTKRHGLVTLSEAAVSEFDIRVLRKEVERFEEQIATKASPQQTGPETARRLVARFPSPEGLSWDEVRVTFSTGDSEIVRLSARDVSRRYGFAELGFSDRRTQKPDKVWIFFRALAEEQGEICRKDAAATDQAKAYVAKLRRRLRGIFGIDGDPFHPYRQENAYAARFIVRMTE
jgi:hypothetical protein